MSATPPEVPWTGSPPEHPERPQGVVRQPSWPVWFAVAGFFTALFATLVIGGTVAAVSGLDTDGTAFVVVGTLIQGLVFAATALGFAALSERPRPWHFGLRRAPFGTALAWAAGGMVTFYVLAIVYGVIVQPDAEQRVTETLGADEGAFGLIVAGIMVIAVAPVVEEFFFRGFFYRALRSRFSWVAAALIDGALFGLIHFDGGGESLLLLPPLAILGVIFCVVYEKTGSLYPVIGMHAFNNMVAYSIQAENGWQVSLVVGPIVLGACALVPRVMDRAPRPLPA